MQCIDCQRCNINIHCNPPNINLVDILLTKLPLELIYKIESYYDYSYECLTCKGLLCHRHSQEAKYYHNYYKESNGFMCCRCCPIRYVIVESLKSD